MLNKLITKLKNLFSSEPKVEEHNHEDAIFAVESPIVIPAYEYKAKAKRAVRKSPAKKATATKSKKKVVKKKR